MPARLLAFAPEEQYSTAAELLADLRTFGVKSSRDQLNPVTSSQDLPTSTTGPGSSSIGKETDKKSVGRHLAGVMGVALSWCGAAAFSAARGFFVDLPQNIRVIAAISCFVTAFLLRMYAASETRSAVPRCWSVEAAGLRHIRGESSQA